jgi:hypothetical protein
MCSSKMVISQGEKHPVSFPLAIKKPIKPDIQPDLGNYQIPGPAARLSV